MQTEQHPGKGHFYRIWEPLDAHTDVAHLTDRVRVQRWHVRRIVSHTARIYQVQICKHERWIPVSQEFAHAAAAWARAQKIVNKQRRVGKV